MYQIQDKAPEGVTFNKVKKPVSTAALPFDQLEVGQFFLAPAADFATNAVKTQASRKSVKGKRFATSKTADGVWVTRTA